MYIHPLICIQPIGGLLKKPKHVANNYLNWWFIKAMYRLYLLLCLGASTKLRKV